MKIDPDNKKQFIYSPTKKCLDLLPIILEITLWGAKYDPDTKAPPKEIAKIRKNRKEYIQNIRGKFKYLDS
jgi:DNA-binding HxlR family transcriptional regulator